MSTIATTLKPRIYLFAFILAFVACKFPTLHLAYYWDECWPYATAITDMYNKGISLLPTAMDPNLSRGHPLFFHALAASWMHVFGGSHVSMHSFALLISVLTLIIVYETALRSFSLRAAILAVSLVGLQEMFFVQSAMLLFEILVTLLCFASIVFYVKERYLLTGLCLAIVFYTKESGLIAGFVIGIDVLIRLFDKNITWKKRLQMLMAVGAPCILIGLFFLLQHHARGWYVFPMYSAIESNWNNFWYSFRVRILEVQFHAQLRWYYLLIPVVIGIVAAIKLRSPRFLTLLLPAICVYCLMDDKLSAIMPGALFFALFIVSLLVPIYAMAGKKLFVLREQRRLIVLMGWFVACFLIFSTFSYFSARYLIVSIVPLVFLCGVFIDKLADLTYRWLFYPAMAATGVITFFAYTTHQDWGDINMGAFAGLEVHQEIVNYFERQQVYDKVIRTCSYMEYMHLTDPTTGFLHGNRTFNATGDPSDKTEYIVVDTLEWSDLCATLRRDTSFKLVYRVANKVAWGEIYKRK